MMESLKIVDIFQSFKMSIWGKMKHNNDEGKSYHPLLTFLHCFIVKAN